MSYKGPLLRVPPPCPPLVLAFSSHLATPRLLSFDESLPYPARRYSRQRRHIQFTPLIPSVLFHHVISSLSSLSRASVPTCTLHLAIPRPLSFSRHPPTLPPLVSSLATLSLPLSETIFAISPRSFISASPPPSASSSFPDALDLPSLPSSALFPLNSRRLSLPPFRRAPREDRQGRERKGQW